MTRYPKPKKQIRTEKEAREYIGDIVANLQEWLLLHSYECYILFPKDRGFKKVGESKGAAIVVDYPYKNFKISIQQSTIDTIFSEKPSSGVWRNLEHLLLHELIHVVLWEHDTLARSRYVSADEIDNAHEACTDHLANSMYAMIEKTREKKK